MTMPRFQSPPSSNAAFGFPALRSLGCFTPKIRAISVSADGKTLYASNSGANSIAVVDLGTQRIRAFVPVGSDPYGAT